LANEAKIHSSSGALKMKLHCRSSLKHNKRNKKLKQDRQTQRNGDIDIMRWMKTRAEEGVNKTFFILYIKNA